MSFDVTVHHLTTDPAFSSPIHILDAAFHIVEAATTPSADWRSVNRVPPVSPHSGSSQRKACFVWAGASPVIAWEPSATSRDSELEDWDAPFDYEETLDVYLLPEFETTDFGEVLSCKPRPGKRKSRSRSRSPSRHFADDVDVNLDMRHNKRHCSHSHPSSAAISISMLIPLPHYHESPDPACPPPPEIAKIPTFRIARSFSPSFSLTTLFARTAWLVPLRGHPPFDGASPARVCTLTTSAPEPLPPEVHSETQSPLCIYWTPLAITQFWTFLLRQRNVNNFGPIAFSYAILQLPDEGEVIGEGKEREGKEREGKSKGGEGTGTGERRATKGKPEAREAEGGEERVQYWEYIKIYHDAQHAMRLRSLLDSFRWEEKGSVGADAPRWHRVLKSARLVLVDEKGEDVVLA